MLSTDREALMVLGMATVLSLYLLVVLAQIRRTHTSLAWGFIFTGLALLAVECVTMMLKRVELVAIPRWVFDWTLLAKAACYAIGFTVWKRDLKFAAYLRRMEMIDDKPQQPEHPAPPATPAPAPPPKPTTDPTDPGVPEDPGKSGGHP